MTKHYHNIVYIRGKHYRIELKEKRLVNIENNNDIREILTQDELDHFRSIVRSY